MNRVTQEQIDRMLDDAPFEEAIFWGKEMVRSYRLPNGFTIAGRAAVVDPANFVYEIGAKYCLEDAKNQLWKFEGYLLQNTLSLEKK